MPPGCLTCDLRRSGWVDGLWNVHTDKQDEWSKLENVHICMNTWSRVSKVVLTKFYTNWQTKTVMPCLHWGLKTLLAQVQLITLKQRFRGWQLHCLKRQNTVVSICFYEKHLDILLKTKKNETKLIHLFWKTNIFEKWFFTHFIFLKPQINNSNDSLYQDPALIQTQLITMKILDKASSLAHSAVYRPSPLNPEPLLALLIVWTRHYSSARTESRTLKTHSTNSHTNTHRVVSPCVWRALH